MKYYIAIVIILVSLPLMGQISLDELLQLAEENNPELKASYGEYEAALEQIPQAQSLPDPQVMLGVFVQSVETRLGPQRASLALSQSFPWFGTLKAQGNVAAIQAEAVLIKYYNKRLTVKRDIQRQINKMYFLNKSQEITEGNIALLETFRELARISFENDKTGLVSLLRVDMEEKELLTRLESIQDSQAQAQTELENILGVQVEQTLSLPDELEFMELPVAREFLTDSVEINNLTVKTLEKSSQAKTEQAVAAGYMGKPSFTLGASYIAIGQRTDMDVPSNGRDAILLPQVGMRIPIFRERYTSMKKQAEIEAETFLQRAEGEKLKLDTRISELLTEYEDAGRRFELYSELTDLAERSVSLLETQFSTGNSGFEELILMERKLLGYRLEIEKARVDNNNIIFEINYLLGR